jgi:hypothetical protein
MESLQLNSVNVTAGAIRRTVVIRARIIAARDGGDRQCSCCREYWSDGSSDNLASKACTVGTKKLAGATCANRECVTGLQRATPSGQLPPFGVSR